MIPLLLVIEDAIHYKHVPRVSLGRTHLLAKILAYNADKYGITRVRCADVAALMECTPKVVYTHLARLCDTHHLFTLLSHDHGILLVRYDGPWSLTAEQAAKKARRERGMSPILNPAESYALMYGLPSPSEPPLQ